MLPPAILARAFISLMLVGSASARSFFDGPNGPPTTVNPTLESWSDPAPAITLGFSILCAVCIGFHSVRRLGGPVSTMKRAYMCFLYNPAVFVGNLVAQLRSNDEWAPLIPDEDRDVPADNTVYDDTVSSPPRSDSSNDIQFEGVDFTVCGYQESWFGDCGWMSVLGISLLLVALWFVVIFDSYWTCQLYGIDSLCYYGNYPITGSADDNQWIFFCHWWIFVSWFGFLLLNKDWLRNWFREPAQLTDAQFIWVKKSSAPQVLTTNPGLAVRFIRRVKKVLAGAGGANEEGDVITETVPVETTVLSDGTPLRYIIFQYRIYFLTEDSSVVKEASSSSSIRETNGRDCLERLLSSNFTTYNTGSKKESGSLAQYDATLGWTLSYVANKAKGVGRTDAEDRLKRLGLNEIPFKVDSIPTLIADEFFTKFFFYQFSVYMVWFWWSYLVIASAEFSVVLFAAFLKMFLKRRNQEIIARLTDFQSTEIVYRDGDWVNIDGRFLVPGDVVRVQSDWSVPCDIVLTAGVAVCDEAGLTGESMPVPKMAAPKDTSNTGVTDHGAAKHTLFAGTTVLQAGSTESEIVTGVVVATGIRTSKGELISHILNPPAMIFKYDEEFTVVFMMMFVLGMALLGFLAFLEINGSPKSPVVKFATGVFTISQVLSPLLPLALVVGEVAASTRLTAMGVFCINPKRIAISGKVRVCAFDKTGTITKEGLDFRGVRQISSAQASFSDGGILPFEAIPQTDGEGERCAAPSALEESESEANLLVQGLATCHAVSMYGTEYVGNQVEVKMFSATGFNIVNVPGQPLYMRGRVGGVARDIEVLKRFEFDHARMSMSVLVRSNGIVYAFCKGAAEKMQTTFVKGSMPEDFISQSQEDASNGYYVLALGYKVMGNVNSTDVMAMKREDVEQDMKPLGLILFRNELKEDSREAITKLREGDVRCVMITGDNAQTGLYVAKASSLISDTRRVFLADATEHATTYRNSDTFSATDVVFWQEMDSAAEGGVLSTTQILDMCKQDDSLELAMTGRAFSHFTLSKTIMDRLLFRTRIFARFSPTQKSDTINLYIEKGQVTAMCGDGGNDCGALRTAHVGLALSEAEASVVSPFTSKTKSINSMVDLLREGRCALATSFASYKYVLTYGQTYAVAKLSYVYYDVTMASIVFLMIDVFMILCLTYALTLSRPRDELTKERPTSSLLGPHTFLSVAGTSIICATFMAICFGVMTNHPEYIKWPNKCSDADFWFLLADNWESTVIAIVFLYQLSFAGLVFAVGGRFRKPVWTNTLVCVLTAIFQIMLISLTLSEPNDWTRLFHMATFNYNAEGTTSFTWQNYQGKNPEFAGDVDRCREAYPGCGCDGEATNYGMPYDLRVTFLIICYINQFCMLAFNTLVIEGPVRRWCIANKFPIKRLEFGL